MECKCERASNSNYKWTAAVAAVIFSCPLKQIFSESSLNGLEWILRRGYTFVTNLSPDTPPPFPDLICDICYKKLLFKASL